MLLEACRARAHEVEADISTLPVSQSKLWRTLQQHLPHIYSWVQPMTSWSKYVGVLDTSGRDKGL